MASRGGRNVDEEPGQVSRSISLFSLGTKTPLEEKWFVHLKNIEPNQKAVEFSCPGSVF